MYILDPAQQTVYPARWPPNPYPETQDKDAPKKAVKCDMCKDLAGGPACVRACPTGAAIRVSPEEFITMKLQN